MKQTNLRLDPVVLIMCLLGASGCRPDRVPATRGSFAFAVLGDTPYSVREEAKLGQLIDQVNSDTLAWVLHVGDILDSPCSDSLIRARFALFQEFRHPFVYTPGDNEWTDCHERKRGRYAPLERLAVLRAVFYPDASRSTGGRGGLGGRGGRVLQLTSQSRDTAYGEFLEHARWIRENMVFATIHMVGSYNGLSSFRGRTAAVDAEVARREAAAIAWLRDAFVVADTLHSPAVFLAMHADPRFGAPIGSRARRGFDPFVQALEEEVEGFDGVVVLAHGDSHLQRVDKPLARRTTGRPLEQFTRLEVFGSPDVGWIRVVVDTTRPEIFFFQPKRLRWTWPWRRR